MNHLIGIFKSFIAALWAAASVVLTKKVQNNTKFELEDNKIILSNFLHIAIIWNSLGSFNVQTDTPWTSNTPDLGLVLFLLGCLSVTTFISTKLLLKTMKIENPTVVSIYEFQVILFTALLDWILLGTTLTIKQTQPDSGIFFT